MDANGMVMRGLVQKTNMGIAAYIYHAQEAANTLKATAEGKTPFEIKDQAKVMSLAQILGVPTDGIESTARAVADAYLASLSAAGPSVFAEALAPASRKQIWSSLGITPGSPMQELVAATARAMTNIDSDYVSLAKAALRLGLSSAYGALIPLQMMQDALFGTAAPHEAEVDLGIIAPDYVNILPHGHEPFVGAALIELARRPEYQRMAREAGAKGLRIVGSIETGQELMQRYETDDVFVGMTGNWISQEYALATGAVDVMAADMNCTLPTLAQTAERYGTKLVCVSELVRVPGVETNLDYAPEKVEQQAAELIRMAVDNFRARRGAGRNDLPKRKIMTGFSTESVLAALGGSLDPLLDAIKSGDIRGAVALVSCSTLSNGPQDSMTVAVAKELIARDILVLSAGCGNAACQVGGLTGIEAQELAGPRLKAVCKALGIPPVLSFGTCADTGRLLGVATGIAGALGVDPSQLPLAVTAPEYMEQKAVVDAFGAVAFGLYTHVSPVPPVTGAPDVVKLLTADVESLTGGRLAVETDPVAAADGITAHIDAKRAALGI